MPDQVKVVLPDGTEKTRTEPILPLRSSTKSGTVGLSSVLVLQLIQMVPWPWPWVTTMIMSAAFAQLLTLVMMYVTARYTKTPIDGGSF